MATGISATCAEATTQAFSARPWRAGADLSVQVCARRGQLIEPIHPQHRRVLKVVKPEAGPLPLFRRGDQASLHGIAMHVAELLQALLVGEDVPGIIPPLPDPILRLVMDCFGQAKARQHLLAPSMAGVAAQGSEKAIGGTLFELLKDARGGRGRPGLDEQVEVIRYQHPSQEPESELTSQAVQDVHKCRAAALAVEHRRPPIGAGSYKLQLARVEDAVVAGHRVRVWLRTESHARGADLDDGWRRPGQKGLRQPAVNKISSDEIGTDLG